MASTKKPQDELEPLDGEADEMEDENLDDEEGDGEEELDLDEIEPSVLWKSIANYTTEMLDDEVWVDPELLPVYTIVLSNLAQIVAQLTNEPPEDDEEGEDDEDVS